MQIKNKFDKENPKPMEKIQKLQCLQKRAQIRGLKNIQWIHGSVESLSDIAQTGTGVSN